MRRTPSLSKLHNFSKRFDTTFLSLSLSPRCEDFREVKMYKNIVAQRTRKIIVQHTQPTTRDINKISRAFIENFFGSELQSES